MKQIAQYQNGKIEFQSVPVPTPPPGGILVRATHSVISLGTEKMKVEQAKMNLLQKARARPDQVRKVMDTAKTLGWKSAYEKVKNRLESPTPLGYSAAGVVEAVDPLNTRFRVGDRVAVGGAECAFHAESIAIPDMLAQKIPDEVPGWMGAYTTIASIALHAVRQTEVQLGDSVLVIGQGLVGLLVTNFLRIAGARVIAVDLDESRRDLAMTVGASRFVNPSNGGDLQEEVLDWTDGFGVDSAVVCVGGASPTPIHEAAHALRDRGRLVDVGILRIELPWKLFYEKEIEVRFSRSYGPGRYDPTYEWGGSDYPIGYVRWTEQRNFRACLALMAEGRLRLDALTTSRVSFENALEIYQRIAEGSAKEIGVVLEYGDVAPAEPSSPRFEEFVAAPIASKKRGRSLETRVTEVDVVGAGNFARTMLLPHLKDQIRLGIIANQTALSANHVKSKFGFQTASANPDEVFQEGRRGAVLIGTRSHLHAPLALRGLEAQRHVFVEKPLALNRGDLAAVSVALSNSSGTLQVGFNRRFAPLSVALKERLQNIPGPKSVSYRVMAGSLDPEHWYANYEESGGRIVGECCHFMDLFVYLMDSDPVSVYANVVDEPEGQLPFPDSCVATVTFRDGSNCQLIYSSKGDTSYPKEQLTVFGAGLVAELVNFQSLTVTADRKQTKSTATSKGHAEQMKAWLEFLNAKAPHPFPGNTAIRSMDLTFGLTDSLRKGAPVPALSREIAESFGG